jgi:RNA polymerase sigma factor (sigma-70 family)
MAETSLTGSLQLLLDRVRAGDNRAAAELFALAGERLLGTARRLLNSFTALRRRGEETGDVLHGAYDRIIRSTIDLKPETVAQFFALAALKLRQQMLDRMRQLKAYADRHSERTENKEGEPSIQLPPRELGARGGEGSPDDFPAEYSDQVVRLEKLDFAIDLVASLDALPEEERQAVELIFWCGFSQNEAGELIGVDPSTIKRRWASARVKLATQLAAYSQGEPPPQE